MKLLRGLAIAALATASLSAQSEPGPSQASALRVIPIRGNVFMIVGAGGNVAASIGRDGTMLVDTGSPAMAETLLQTVRDLERRVMATGLPPRGCVGVSAGCTWWSSSNFLPSTVAPPAPRPIAAIVNTSADAEHIGGNALVASAGRTFGVRNLLDRSQLGAWIVAHENVATRLSPKGVPSVPAAALPSEVYFGDEKKLNFFNGEAVVVTHIPRAHSDGDSVVHFRGSDVLVAGDFVNMTHYPVIDVERGGSIQGIVEGANKLLDIAVVEHMMEGGTMIVPGHGRLIDSADLAYYRDMVTIMRDRVRELRRRGMSLEQIQKAGITRDYDPRLGRDAAWTPAKFIEAIFRTLPPGS